MTSLKNSTTRLTTRTEQHTHTCRVYDKQRVLLHPSLILFSVEPPYNSGEAPCNSAEAPCNSVEPPQKSTYTTTRLCLLTL
jgi:hypothetical protein